MICAVQRFDEELCRSCTRDPNSHVDLGSCIHDARDHVRPNVQRQQLELARTQMCAAWNSTGVLSEWEAEMAEWGMWLN